MLHAIVFACALLVTLPESHVLGQYVAPCTPASGSVYWSTVAIDCVHTPGCDQDGGGMCSRCTAPPNSYGGEPPESDCMSVCGPPPEGGVPCSQLKPCRECPPPSSSSTGDYQPPSTGHATQSSTSAGHATESSTGYATESSTGYATESSSSAASSYSSPTATTGYSSSSTATYTSPSSSVYNASTGSVYVADEVPYPEPAKYEIPEMQHRLSFASLTKYYIDNPRTAQIYAEFIDRARSYYAQCKTDTNEYAGSGYYVDASKAPPPSYDLYLARVRVSYSNDSYRAGGYSDDGEFNRCPSEYEAPPDAPAEPVDEDGYYANGYNSYGYDVNGYDPCGYSEAGYDRDGWSRDGSHYGSEYNETGGLRYYPDAYVVFDKQGRPLYHDDADNGTYVIRRFDRVTGYDQYGQNEYNLTRPECPPRPEHPSQPRPRPHPQPIPLNDSTSSTCLSESEEVVPGQSTKHLFLRKSSHLMSGADWTRFRNAWTSLVSGGTVETLRAVHAGMFSQHGSLKFGPWHREFIARLEDELHRVDPCVFLPYWDPVVTPQFPAGLTAPGFPPAVNGSAVRRQLGSGSLPNAGMQTSLLQSSTFTVFSGLLEIYHNQVHVFVCGDMCFTDTASKDPVFYVHHANIDRLWWEWQKTHAQPIEAELTTIGPLMFGASDTRSYTQVNNITYVVTTRGAGYRYL